MAKWETTAGCNIPDNAILAGHEENGRPLFIARASMDGKWTSGKCGTFLTGGAYIPFGGKECIVKNYEVLVYPKLYEWKLDSDGNVPERAVQTDTGLYVGRTLYSGSMIPCKISTSHGCAYFGYTEKEHSTKNYEVLCHIK